MERDLIDNVQDNLFDWIEKDISSLGIKVMPPMPSYIEHLDCSGNRLKALGRLPPNLRFLNFSGNSISDLNPISNCLELNTVIGIDNCIRDIPVSVYKLKIVNLILAGNPIYQLNDSIEKMKSLQVLDLRRTSISVLPEGIFQLPNLQSLVLSDRMMSYAYIQRLNNHFSDRLKWIR